MIYLFKYFLQFTKILLEGISNVEFFFSNDIKVADDW